MVHQKSIGYLLEIARHVVAGLLLAVAVITAVSGLTKLVWAVGDFIWRWPRGYIHWDIEFALVCVITSILMFAALCFFLAKAVFYLRWSRRTSFWVLGLGAGSFVGFAIFILMLGTGLSEIS